MSIKKGTSSTNQLEITVLRGKVLGVQVFRGYSRLCDLSTISKPDIYDQINNPLGTQRDLSPAHARAAYDYVKTMDLAFWPEVFLSVRNKEVMKYIPVSDDNPDIGQLIIDLEIATNPDTIAISRIDGNHRLHYASGKIKNYSPIEKEVSFCLALGLSRDEEIQLFKDINDNQKPMNTSHLDNIEVRLTPEEQLKRRNPELFIAQKLGRDNTSPMYNRVYEGGVHPFGVEIPLRSLRTGIEYMVSRSTMLPRLEDTDAQYEVIKNYFLAVKQWHPEGWSRPQEYIILRGVGLWAICFIGAHVIDHALMQGEFSIQYMLEILKSGKDWDWSRGGDFKGYSGRGGALEISKQVTHKFNDGSRLSGKDLIEKILNSRNL